MYQKKISRHGGTNEVKSNNEGTTLHAEEESDIDGSNNEVDEEGEEAGCHTSIGSEGHNTDPR